MLTSVSSSKKSLTLPSYMPKARVKSMTGIVKINDFVSKPIQTNAAGSTLDSTQRKAPLKSHFSKTNYASEQAGIKGAKLIPNMSEKEEVDQGLKKARSAFHSRKNSTETIKSTKSARLFHKLARSPLPPSPPPGGQTPKRLLNKS